MNPQIQTATAPAVDSDDVFAQLLTRPHTVAPMRETESQTLKRWVIVQEIMGEVEVERQIDFGYSICAQCKKRYCPCEPRTEERFRQTVRYAVEMPVSTVIALV